MSEQSVQLNDSTSYQLCPSICSCRVTLTSSPRLSATLTEKLCSSAQESCLGVTFATVIEGDVVM